MTTVFLSDESITLGNGIEGQPWQVETGNPAHFYQLISARKTVEAAHIYAQTFLPEGVDNPAGVIIVPGSMGVAPSHIRKAELLTEAGIGACIVDPFGARGVSSTVANQAQYSFAASAWDVLAVLQQLAGRGEVDPDRIGAQGHSRGGSAVLSAASLQRIFARKGRLVGVYAAYPWCGQQFLNPDVGRTKVRAVVGDQDEWCLPQQIQGHIQALRLCGSEASLRIFAGAHHSFDRDTPVEMVEDASVAPGAPTIYINDDGSMIHPATGASDPAWTERDLMLYGIKAGYGIRGARIGTSEQFADAFHEDMLSFWKEVLA